MKTVAVPISLSSGVFSQFVVRSFVSDKSPESVLMVRLRDRDNSSACQQI